MDDTSDYWTQFYTQSIGKVPQGPSSFARFVADRVLGEDYSKRVLDMGAGTCRDSTYFVGKGFLVHAFDQVVVEGVDPRVVQLAGDVEDAGLYHCEGQRYDVYYSRFFFHAIPFDSTERSLQNIPSGGLLAAEFRISGDEPTYLADHERCLWESNTFLSTLIANGFVVEYARRSKGLAPLVIDGRTVEDPFLLRVIATKC